MRLLHVCLDGNLPRYGIGLAVVRLCEALAAAGERTTLACRAPNAAQVAAPGVEVLPLERRTGLLVRSRWGYLRQMAPALRAPQDVVHVHGVPRAAWWLRSRRLRRGAPLVVTCHSEHELGPSASASNESEPERARRHGEHVRRVLARVDAVVVHSRFAQALAVEAGAPPERVSVLPLGPTDDAPPAPAAHEGFAVLALLRFVPTKGAEILVEAFGRAFGGDRDATLTIAGEGPTRDACVARARALGLGERARFPGWVEGAERAALLAGADAVVVPSISGETFCLAALDGQAAGVPVVVTSQGSLPERAEGGAALVVPLGDAEALAVALARLRAEPALRASLAARGLAAAAGHRWDVVAREHVALYRRLCDGGVMKER